MVIIVLILLIVVVGLIIEYSQDKGDKQRISKYLHRRGATNIAISREWFDMDRDNRTFQVEYKNRRGDHCQTSCKIQKDLLSLSSGEIYWRDVP